MSRAVSEDTEAATPSRTTPRCTMLVTIATALIAVWCLAACSSGGSNSATATSSTTERTGAASGTSSETPGSVPQYRLQVGKKSSSLEVYVAKLPTPSEASAIVGDLQTKYADREDGYFVTISCEESGKYESGNRLANGKFAVGSIGAARTGLEEGTSQITPVPDAQCPAEVVAPADPAAVTAQQVVDAVVAAGLPATDPRDNSSRICKDAGCVQLITTDDFSAYQFPDVATADKWAAVYPLGYRSGTIFLRYTEGGSKPTDRALIPQYNAVLDGLLK